MTREEWEAIMVERALAGDWPSIEEKTFWSKGPCEKCGHLLESYMYLAECRCKHMSFLVLRNGINHPPELVPPCEKCHTHINSRREFIVASEINGIRYDRYSCSCRYYTWGGSK